MTAGRVLTEPLGGSALSLAAQRRALPAALQPRWPETPAEWRTHVEQRRGTPRAWLDQLEGALGSPPGRLSRAAAENGVVVTTGQQPGLFGGPLYTLSKAITALELADAVEAATGVRAAPVFWAATDDADFVEAATAFAADAGGLHEIAHTTAPPAGTPMATAPLGPLHDQLARLQAACGSGAHATYFALAQRAYADGATVGGAYVELLRGLLHPLGIAVLDASHPALRGAARPVLADMHASAGRVADARAACTAAISAAGFSPQVDDDRALSVVFALEQGIKRRLRADERTPGVGVPLSANVIARPVLERELLPTVAYVAGPGELAYFPQADAVAEALGKPRLVVVPRWSGTVIEPYVERALKRLEVSYEDLQDAASIERRIARASLPAGVASAWVALTTQVDAAVQGLGRAVHDAKLMPPAVIEGLSRSLGHRLGRAERRLLAAAKRANEAVRLDLTTATAALWPRGKRQERLLNFIPMLARGGDGLLAEMRAAAREHARRLVGAG